MKRTLAVVVAMEVDLEWVKVAGGVAEGWGEGGEGQEGKAAAAAAMVVHDLWLRRYDRRGRQQ